MPVQNPLLIDVPERLHTPRLTLRAFRPGDGPALHAALVESLEALRRHLWFLPWVAEEQTLASAEIRCRRAAANFLARTDLAYLAFETSSERLVGSVGLHRTDWALPKTEVGYWIRPSAGGRGYVSEGVSALTAWAFDGLQAQRVELVTDAENTASRRVADRCGFTLEGVHRNTQRGQDGSLRSSCVYARLPPGQGGAA